MFKSLALVLALAAPAAAQTPVSEVLSAALVGPFDQTIGHKSYITVHSPGAFSPTTQLPQIVTHWTFWSDSCLHLADFQACLTKDDSLVVDPSDMGGIGVDNERLDSRFDLTGYRGMFTVHAFEATDRCRDAGDLGYLLVPEAIHGTWSIATELTNAAFGDRAQSMNTGELGGIVVPDERFEALDLPFFQPDSLQDSDVILLTVVENFGDFPGEIGPPQGRVVIGARAKTCDTQEVCLSLPDVQLGCALFSSLKPGPGALIPETAMPASSGFFRLSTPRFVVEDPAIVGEDLWIYGWHGQQLGPFGTGSRATYDNPLVELATPTPTPSPTPTATPEPSPTLATATPGVSPTPSVTPAGSPTPTLTGTPGSPTPTGSATPSATPSSSPAATPSSTPEASPTAVGSPSPLPTVSPTPTASSTPGPTPSAALPTPTIFGP
jgi:hypothetical protein